MATSTKSKTVYYSVQVPVDVSIRLDKSIIAVKGPLGENTKDFTKTPIELNHEGGMVIVKPCSERKKYLAIANTARFIIKNMIEGVTKGYTYKLKVVFAHFPVSVKVKGNEVHIENFYGERSPRIAKSIGNCRVSVEGDDVIVHGISKEDVGQTAANIERTASIRRKDQRVFLDGIYVYEKAS